jgi:hypothetical protein
LVTVWTFVLKIVNIPKQHFCIEGALLGPVVTKYVIKQRDFVFKMCRRDKIGYNYVLTGTFIAFVFFPL